MKTIFRNRFLELLTKTNIQIHVVWYLSIAIALLWTGGYLSDFSIMIVCILFVLGFLTWSFIEYIMHRYVFHFVSENQLIRRFHYIFHGVHHENPNDERRTLMPPVPGLLFTGIYLGIAWLLMGESGFILISGLITGYLCYSGIHYSIHVYRAPKYLQFLWTHHLLHHYQQPERAFGVTTRFWDRVFSTMPEKRNRGKA